MSGCGIGVIETSRLLAMGCCSSCWLLAACGVARNGSAEKRDGRIENWEWVGTRAGQGLGQVYGGQVLLYHSIKLVLASLRGGLFSAHDCSFSAASALTHSTTEDAHSRHRRLRSHHSECLAHLLLAVSCLCSVLRPSSGWVVGQELGVRRTWVVGQSLGTVT